MRFYLFLAFIIIPFIEMLLLIRIGSLIGFWVTLLFVVFTAFLGAHLARTQGFQTLSQIQQQLEMGMIPAGKMLEGAMILVAAALLLTPGFLTDSLGFLLLTPPVRSLILRELQKFWERAGKIKTHVPPEQQDSKFTEYEIVDEDETESTP